MKNIRQTPAVKLLTNQPFRALMFGWFLGAWIGTIIGNAQMIIAGTIVYAVINFGIIYASKDLRKL